MSQFFPRPEAQATTWDELMPPVQKAVHDLLVRIHGAHYSVRDKNTVKSADSSLQQTGNCFLVYGSRGTGKTTVLLNAQKAVDNKSGAFFKPKEAGEKDDAKYNIKDHAQKNAESLRKDSIIWLDILNLEPIPSEANLLTVLLTQVKNALHTHCDKRSRDQRSIFEEEADSAQQLLNRLIGDTTLMWQNISEPDTRNISARQVKAADIYAEFQKKFNQAIDKLIEELSDTRGSDSKVSIVLPIDNIDRSTEHLQSIVKLAQLVFHPNLWLVMAGDRVEVETFLERAYWKELIRSADGAGARGKMDSDGEDEALVMARRQANAAAQKLWPANHRVEINFLTPGQTLAFEYKQNSSFTLNTERTLNIEIKTPCAEYEEHIRFSCKCYSATNKATIRNLLAKTLIPTTEGQRKGKNSSISLFNLFYVEKEVTGHVEDEIKLNEKYLTRAACHGLSLPARSVLDLWQLLKWLTNDSSTNIDDFKAEKVARTMLRNAISSSDLPSRLAQDFQNDIIRRGEKGGTVLYFENGTLLNVIPMTSANRDFEHALTPVFLSKHKLRSQLKVNNIEDIGLELRYDSLIKKHDSSEKQYPQPFVTENAHDYEKRTIELPPLVAAWLMVMYDILILAEATASSWVIGSSYTNGYPNVLVKHRVIQNGKNKIIDPLEWIPPDWNVFLGRNIFSLRWQDFRKKILKAKLQAKETHKAKLQDRETVTRLLAAGWVFCVLKTSFVLINSIEEKFHSIKYDDAEEKTADEFKKIADEFNLLKFPEVFLQNSKVDTIDTIDTIWFEEEVMKLAGQFHQFIQYAKDYQLTQEQVEKKPDKIEQDKIVPAAYEIMIETEKWLETDFFYFLSYAYVPIELDASNNRFKALWKLLSESKSQKGTYNSLTCYWEKEWLFFLDEFRKKLADSEDEVNGDTETIKVITTEKNGKSTTETIIETTKKTIPLGDLLFADLSEQRQSTKPSSEQ